MNGDKDNPIGKEQWEYEAVSAMQDMKPHVYEVFLADIEPTDKSIHINLTTVEKSSYCVELSSAGFRIVGDKYNQIDKQSNNYFETPFSFLDSISPAYKQSFSNALHRKLEGLSYLNS